MKKVIINKLLLVAAVAFIGAVSAYAQQSFKMTIYFDYAFNLTNDGYITSGEKDMNNQFNFRRAYFNFENKILDNLKFCFRYDVDSVRKADIKGAITFLMEF